VIIIAKNVEFVGKKNVVKDFTQYSLQIGTHTLYVNWKLYAKKVTMDFRSSTY